MKRLFGSLAVVGFSAALVVHILVLFGIDVAGYFPFVWLLHVGIFIVFIPMVIYARRAESNESNGRSKFGDSFPGWAKVVIPLLAAYVAINFLIFIMRTDGGTPILENGHYLLKEHGRLIRELSGNEYHRYKLNELRGMSGHWLIFYFVPALYFLSPKGKT